MDKQLNSEADYNWKRIFFPLLAVYAVITILSVQSSDLTALTIFFTNTDIQLNIFLYFIFPILGGTFIQFITRRKTYLARVGFQTAIVVTIFLYQIIFTRIEDWGGLAVFMGSFISMITISVNFILQQINLTTRK
ncbi:MAG: hypothetical protein WCV79_03495 [Candidatus Paceibacterota bacterium]|jgi:hypothetical protein